MLKSQLVIRGHHARDGICKHIKSLMITHTRRGKREKDSEVRVDKSKSSNSSRFCRSLGAYVCYQSPFPQIDLQQIMIRYVRGDYFCPCLCVCLSVSLSFSAYRAVSAAVLLTIEIQWWWRETQGSRAEPVTLYTTALVLLGEYCALHKTPKKRFSRVFVD